MVAAKLRERILSGEIRDGGVLPKHEELLQEFQISLPSVREALRILETEGLVTVQRGNVGGAIVHLPNPDNAAYTLALILQSRCVPLNDVIRGIQQLEPSCVGACARRPDRLRQVVPALREVLEAADAVIEDPIAYGREAQRFHNLLVASCGNETTILVLGALQSLWWGQVQGVRQRRVGSAIFADETQREESYKEHWIILRAIEQGDFEGGERAARAHLFNPRSDAFVESDLLVDASLVLGTHLI
jgi:DNA-binding FadR family transcriptional regulator